MKLKKDVTLKEESKTDFEQFRKIESVILDAVSIEFFNCI